MRERMIDLSIIMLMDHNGAEFRRCYREDKSHRSSTAGLQGSGFLIIALSPVADAPTQLRLFMHHRVGATQPRHGSAAKRAGTGEMEEGRAARLMRDFGPDTGPAAPTNTEPLSITNIA